MLVWDSSRMRSATDFNYCSSSRAIGPDAPRVGANSHGAAQALEFVPAAALAKRVRGNERSRVTLPALAYRAFGDALVFPPEEQAFHG